jgi:hypothetical protein
MVTMHACMHTFPIVVCCEDHDHILEQHHRRHRPENEAHGSQHIGLHSGPVGDGVLNKHHELYALPRLQQVTAGNACQAFSDVMA